MPSDASARPGLSAAEIDREYNFRVLVPEHPAHFARWAQRSDAARAALGGTLDIAYGDHPRQRLDLFPAGAAAPLLAFFHGGYWRAMDKETFAFIAQPFVAAGIAVANVEYALCPTVTLDALTAQAEAAVAWLAANAGGHGVDTGRLVVSGHSAGGHLAVSLAETLPGLVAGAVGISGIYDLEPMRLFEANAQLRLDEAAARRASPLLHVPTRPAAPLLLTLGARETAEMHRQSAAMDAAWRAAGHRASLRSEPGADHFTVLDHLADPAGGLHAAVRAFVEGA